MLLRYLLTIALFAHGVGHLLFLVNSWGYWNGDKEGSSSWLYSGVLGAGQTPQGILGLPHPPGVVATIGACLCGRLPDDDYGVLG